MKYVSWMIAGMLAVALALAQPAPEVAQLKSDLIGQSMGGRERSWKFQSLEQIQELVIQSQSGDATQRVYVIALKLKAARGGRYAADARVEYVNAGRFWRIKHVGLLSIKKLE